MRMWLRVLIALVALGGVGHYLASHDTTNPSTTRLIRISPCRRTRSSPRAERSRKNGPTAITRATRAFC